MESQPRRDKYKESRHGRKMYKGSEFGVCNRQMVCHVTLKTLESFENLSLNIQSRMKESQNNKLFERWTRRRAIMGSVSPSKVGSLLLWYGCSHPTSGMGPRMATLLGFGRRRGGLLCPNWYVVRNSTILFWSLSAPRGGEHRKKEVICWMEANFECECRWWRDHS